MKKNLITLLTSCTILFAVASGSHVETVSASSDEGEQITKYVPPRTQSAIRTINKRYLNVSYIPNRIFHKEVIDNHVFEGYLSLVSINRLSTGVYIAKFTGEIIKTPKLANSNIVLE